MSDFNVPKMYPQIAKMLPRTPTTRVDSLDRYNNHWLAGIDHNGVEMRTWETWERPDIPNAATPGVKFYYVKPSDAYRPDIIAQKTLSNPRLWWWILYSNKLFEPSQVRAGITLLIAQPPYSLSETPRY